MPRFAAQLLGGLAALWLGAGCAALPSPQERLLTATQLTAAQNWQRLDLVAPPFVLTAFRPAQFEPENAVAGQTLTVYIEGDGLAWRSSTVIADDPTPINPMGLRLALRHPSEPVAYLARPCQYRTVEKQTACDNRFWTSHRFAPEVIEASSAAITQLKAMASASSLRLVGFSGGGAVAALVAARRHDVIHLITVAGNLDHASWTEHHLLTPLSGSLSPGDSWPTLSTIPQQHLVGGNDTVVGESVARAFQRRFPEGRQPAIRLFPAYNHDCCWEEAWPEIYRHLRKADSRDKPETFQRTE